MDAIMLLKDDHKAVEGIFRKFEQAGDRAYATKRKLVDRMIRELSIHAQVEEQAFYPAVREAVRQTEDEVLESLEEHHIVKRTLAELEETDPRDERFEAKVTVLIESVRHHMKEEERELFPQVRKALSRGELRDLGEQMRTLKSVVPDRPHPHAPDAPPGNVIAGLGAMVLDRAKDAATQAIRRVAP